MNDKILKRKAPVVRMREDLPIFSYNYLKLLPDEDCVFDSYRGTIGFDIFPFAVTTRVAGADNIFLKLYENDETH